MSVSQVTTTLAASLDVVSPRGTLVRPLSAITRTLVPLLGALKGHERKHTWRGKALGEGFWTCVFSSCLRLLPARVLGGGNGTEDMAFCCLLSGLKPFALGVKDG